MDGTPETEPSSDRARNLAALVARLDKPGGSGDGS